MYKGGEEDGEIIMAEKRLLMINLVMNPNNTKYCYIT
jgi:hypothetical protein